MKYIFSIGFMLMCFANPVQAQTEGVDVCANGLPGAEMLGIDSKAYCDCVADRSHRNPAAFKDSVSPDGKRRIMAEMKPCLDEHIKKPVFTMCEKENASGGGGPRMDCGCFYDSMVQSFTGSIAVNSPESITQDQKAQMAQQAVTKCFK